MNITDRVKNFFRGDEPLRVKATEEVGKIIAPEFKEIPPDLKSGMFLKEGFRSWSYIAICAIADEIASTDLKVMISRGDNWIEKKEHPILTLMENPNPLQTKEEFLWLMTAFLLSEGEAPVLVNRSKNPDEMVMLDPSKLKIIWDDTNMVKEYKYMKRNGSEETLDADLVFLIKAPNYLTPFRGMGVMNFIRKTLDLDNYMEEYLRIFFFNDATPNAVLQTDQTLSESVIKRIVSQFKQKFSGVRNKHKLAILEKGLKWQEISSKFGDLQMTAIENSVRNKILAAYKVPKSVVGITEDVNRANGENEDRVFARRAILPRLRMIQSQLNKFLMPKFSKDESVWLEFENPVSEDIELQAKVDEVYLRTGVYTTNEVRERLGLEPIDEPEESEEPEEPEEEPEDVDKSFTSICKDFLTEKNGHMEFTEEQKEIFHEEKIKLTDEIEERFNKKLERFFKRQKRELLEQVKNIKQDSLIELNEERETELMVKLSAPFIGEAIEKQSALVFATLGKEGFISSKDEKAKDFINKHSVKLAETTTATTKRVVDKTIKEWAEEEASIASLKNRLSEKLQDKKRAETITRTEVSRSAGWATNETYRQLKIEGKQWLTAKDERTCEFCRPMDGKIIPRKNNFWNKGEVMVGDDGGELDFGYEGVSQFPLHPNCITGDNVVVSPDAEKLTRVKYSGEIIKLHLSDGTLISVTPNHPILTQRGFVAASRIKNTDKLIKVIDDKRIVFSDPNNNTSPATISDVFVSLQKSSGVTTTSVPVTTKDFHGDGKFGDGNIDIISSDGFLRDAIDSSFNKPITQAFFNRGYSIPFILDCKSDLATVFLALGLSSDGIVSGEDVPRIFTDASFAHHKSISIRDAANYNSRIEKSLSDSSSIDVESFGKTVLGLSGIVSFNDIVDIKIDSHNGYVYDISSSSTLYSVNGVLSSNCRCDLLPVFSKEEIPDDPLDYKKDSKIRKREIEIEKKERNLIDKESNLITKEKEVEKTLEELEKMQNEL